MTFVRLHRVRNAPKARQCLCPAKEFQRQRELETRNGDGNTPGSPMTTMSMFIDPDFTQSRPEEPVETKTPTNIDRSQKISTARGNMGRRSLTDPISASTADSTITTEPSSFGKLHSGFGYIKSKLTGRSKRKDFESPAQSFTKPAPSEYTPNMPSVEILPIIWRNEATSKVVPATREKLPRQPLPSHVSTATMQTVATPQSRYASLLKNDAMILGDLSMSPTRSGSYAIAGYPSVVGVSHTKHNECSRQHFRDLTAQFPYFRQLKHVHCSLCTTKVIRCFLRCTLASTMRRVPASAAILPPTATTQA